MTEAPKYLYKVLAYPLWQDSLGKEQLILPPEESACVQFYTLEQLPRVLLKHWAMIPKYMVLKVDPTLLQGRFVVETNPKGTTKYYRLYDGTIPLKAVIESSMYVRKC